MSHDPVRAALDAAGIATRSGRVSWSRAAVADAFADYHSAHGRWPSPDDFNPSRAGARGNTEAVARFLAGHYPYVGTVYKHYGSWPAARAAGQQKLDARNGRVPPAPSEGAA